MAITPAQYAPFITTIDTTIGQALHAISPRSTRRQWTTDKTMSGSIWSTGWTGRMAKPRPWFGSRVITEPAPQTYQVTPIPYELTYAIDRFILEDSDVNGPSIFWAMLPDMAYRWAEQPEYELRDLLEGTGVQASGNGLGGNRQNGLDGLTMFNTAHPIDYYNPNFNGGGNALFASGTYCNDFTGGGQTINGTLIGGALSIASFSTLYEYAQMIPDEIGEALGVKFNGMMIPSSLETLSMFILKSTLLASPNWGGFATITGQVGSADNQLAKLGVQLIVNPYLRNTKRWYMMDLTQPTMPFLWITRDAPRTVPRTNENDNIVFDQHRMVWGGWDRVCPAPNYSWMFARSGP